VQLRNVKSGETRELRTDGVFVFIGHTPNTELFQGQLRMDERGYLVTDERLMTSVDGVFAAGEVQDPTYRQVTTSVGQGAAAGMMLERWLEARS
jgi:thioredoxin reductase (NADPH)